MGGFDEGVRAVEREVGCVLSCIGMNDVRGAGSEALGG